VHELVVVKGGRRDQGRRGRRNSSREEEARRAGMRVSTLERRGHRKYSSGINKAIVDYGSDIAPQLRRVSARKRGSEVRRGNGGWRKGRVKMGRAMSVIAE